MAILTIKCRFMKFSFTRHVRGSLTKFERQTARAERAGSQELNNEPQCKLTRDAGPETTDSVVSGLAC